MGIDAPRLGDPSGQHQVSIIIIIRKGSTYHDIPPFGVDDSFRRDFGQ